MAKKKGSKWEIVEESIYNREGGDRIQQAFELIVPDVAKAAMRDKDIASKKTNTKIKKVQ